MSDLLTYFTGPQPIGFAAFLVVALVVLALVLYVIELRS